MILIVKFIISVHLDELADICKLADAFFCPYLDDVLAEFLLAHLSFIFDSDHIVHSIPERVSQLLSNKLRENFTANHQLPSSSPVLEKNNEESEPELAAASPILEANYEESEPGSTLFIDYANDLLEALSNRQMNTTELARFLSTSCNRRRRKVEHRRVRRYFQIINNEKNFVNRKAIRFRIELMSLIS